MSSLHHCDKCGTDYAYDTTHVCDYGDRIEELEDRIAALEAAPRLVLAYQAIVDVDHAFVGGRPQKPRLVGTYLDKDRAVLEATAAAEKIRREPGCCMPGLIKPRPPFPVIVVASAAGRGNVVALGDVVDVIE